MPVPRDALFSTNAEVVARFWEEEARTMRLMATVMGENAGKVKYKGSRRCLTWGEAAMYSQLMACAAREEATCKGEAGW